MLFLIYNSLERKEIHYPLILSTFVKQ